MFTTIQNVENAEIIGHPATLTDLHRFLWDNFDQEIGWVHNERAIILPPNNPCERLRIIPYDSSKELLDQSEETLQQIINLINNNK